MADSTQFNQSFASGRPGDKAEGGSAQQDFAQIGSELVDALGNRAEVIVNEQKTRAASEIASLAAMVRNAAQCIDQRDRGAVSDYATQVAGEIDRFADRLRVSSWRVLAADVEDFARRWPALFMASSAVAGFVLGRVAMSAAAAPEASSLQTGTPIGEPIARPESAATGGTLSAGSAASGFGLPAGETP
jgi:hypothetical protein